MRGLKLRIVVAWMLLVLAAACLLLTRVWKEHEYVAISRALIRGEKDRVKLQNAVMLLETDVRALRQPSRLEMLARSRFGLIDPGPPITVQADGRVLAGNSVADSADGGATQSARWRGGLAWRSGGL